MKKVRTFKVIADTCYCNTNKILNCGEIVKESDFQAGRADLLVKRQFLKEIDPEIKNSESTEANEDPLDSNKGTQNVDLRPGIKQKVTPPQADKHDLHADDPDNLDLKPNQPINETPPNNDIDAISIEALIEDLQEAKVKFDLNASKEDLYKLWLTI